MHQWQTARFVIDLRLPKVMGIVNVTPDSFSDGGRYQDTGSALKHAEQLVKEGADILDVGGESTRPGSPAVGLDDELQRLLPILRELVTWNVPISVDTYKPEVMAAALELGCDIVNDVWALRQEGAMDVVSAHPRCGVCLMHMHATPQTMHAQHMQGDVLRDVKDFLEQRVARALQAGVTKERLVIDPGYGFGKTVEDNFALLARQQELQSIGVPVLAGWSRKGSLGVVTGKPVGERMVASVSAALLAIERGARIVRVHDVADTVDGIKVWCALNENSPAVKAN